MKFSVKHFISKCEQTFSFLFTFTKEILIGKLHFLCSEKMWNKKTWYSYQLCVMPDIQKVGGDVKVQCPGVSIAIGYFKPEFFMGNVEFLQLRRITGTRQLTNISHSFTNRNRGSQMFRKIGVLKYFPIFTGTPPVAASVPNSFLTNVFIVTTSLGLIGLIRSNTFICKFVCLKFWIITNFVKSS